MARKPVIDDENPELTDDAVARARPFRELHPQFFEAWQKNKGGRPHVESPKRVLAVRMAADVVNGVKATGKGYNGRLENLIREALANGKLSP